MARPCKNPKCPSVGSAHPNCQCYYQGGGVWLANGGMVDSDAALVSDDPQSQIASQGWGKVLDGGEQTGEQFQDPRQQELGLQQPAIDPVDIVGGGVAGKIAPTFAEAVMASRAPQILGNEIGAVGRSISARASNARATAARASNARANTEHLAAQLRAHVGQLENALQNAGVDEAEIRRTINRAKLLGPGTVPEEYRELAENVQVAHLRAKPIEDLSKSKGGGRYKTEVVTVPNEDAGINIDDLPKGHLDKIQKIKDKDLSFFDPQDSGTFAKHVVDTNAKGDIRGVLGIDDNQVTQSIKVDPAHRGKGIASKLYKKALDEDGLLRSSTIDHQLEGGQGLWEKFAKEHPHHVRQARDPVTLRPLTYKVWEAKTNVPLRKQEMALESKIDETREKIKDLPKPVSFDGDLRFHQKEIDSYRKNIEINRENLAKELGLAHTDPLLMSDSIADSLPSHVDKESVDFLRGKIKRSEEMLKFHRSEMDEVLKKEKALKSPEFDKLQSTLGSLITKHRAVNKKSKHTLYNAAGALGAGAAASQLTDNNYAEGGYINTDVTSDDPQAQVSGQGWGQILDHNEPTSEAFADPRMQEAGLEQPVIDPIDMIGGAVAGRIGSALGRDAASILGNEVGALGDWKKAGYKLKHHANEFGHPLDHKYGGDYIRAYDKNGKEVGSVFYGSTSPETITPAVVIDPEHQRKGLATAMYQMAEEKSGRRMVPEVSMETGQVSHSKAAEALWNQPNRPFGQPLTPTAPKAYSLPMDEVVKASESKVVAQSHPYTKQSIDHFGTTADIRETGYIMPEGEMLDLSGRHYSEDHPSLKGRRNVDHRELPEGILDAGSLSASDRMIKFQQLTGAIRHSPETGGVDLSVAPTRQQIMKLSEHYSNNPAGLVIEITNPNNGEIIDSTTIPKPSYGALKKHFDDKFGSSKKKNYAEGGAVEGMQDAPQDIQTTNVFDPTGQLVAIPTANLQSALQEGYKPSTPQDLFHYQQSEKYGTGEQQLKTVAEGVAQGFLGPAAPYIEKNVFGVKDADIQGRAAINPGEKLGGEIGGLIAPAIISGGASLAGKAGLTGVEAGLKTVARYNQANLIDGVGSIVAKKLAPTSLAGKIGTAAARSAIESALLTGSDETSKMIINEPGHSAHSAISAVALSGLLGGAIGGTFGGVGALFDAKAGSKASQLLADFKAATKQHIETPDPVKSMHEEMSAYLSEIHKVGDETWGTNGIKAEAIKRLVPKELNEPIVAQVNGIITRLEDSLSSLKLKNDPHANLLEEKLAKFKQSLNNEEPASIFNSIQELKQELQVESKYSEGVSPLSERNYRTTVKGIAHDLRVSLEDSKTWGDAAHVQAEINSAAAKFFPATKDFLKLMTTKVMGESHIDPGKIQTYLNQLGKANAEIKQTKLQNFLDHGDAFKTAVNKAYSRVGIESPIEATSLNYTLSTLGEKTAGKKLADFLFSRVIGETAGKATGAAVGGTLSHAVGLSTELGAIVGGYALGPFFSSVLPGIAKAVLSLPNSTTGLRAAADYGNAVVKGQQLLSNATKNVFRLGTEVLPQSYMPKEKDRAKLQKVIDAYTGDPTKLLSAENKVGHYLPEHAGAISKTTMNAINYLNSIKPTAIRKSPLDPRPIVNPVAKAKYENALNIAEQPLYVFHKIQQGTLNHNDVEALAVMYPDYYNGMKAKLIGQIADMKAKGKPIPYRTQNVLSLFLGQPMNSTVTPMGIQSMQAAQAQKAPEQAPPARSTSSLNKMPQMYSTPGQTGASRRQRP